MGLTNQNWQYIIYIYCIGDVKPIRLYLGVTENGVYWYNAPRF